MPETDFQSKRAAESVPHSWGQKLITFLQARPQGANIVLACIVGLLVGVAAIAFHELLHLVQKIALGSNSPMATLPGLAWYWKVSLPAIGGLLVTPIVTRWAVEAEGTRRPGSHGSGSPTRRYYSRPRGCSKSFCLSSDYWHRGLNRTRRTRHPDWLGLRAQRVDSSCGCRQIKSGRWSGVGRPEGLPLHLMLQLPERFLL